MQPIILTNDEIEECEIPLSRHTRFYNNHRERILETMKEQRIKAKQERIKIALEEGKEIKTTKKGFLKIVVHKESHAISNAEKCRRYREKKKQEKLMAKQQPI